MIKKLFCCEDYYVSDEGYVFAKNGVDILKPSTNHNGYQIINIMVDGKRKGLSVHTAVLNTFNPEGKTTEKNQINHKNGNKKDNRLTNLEWVSPQENITHSIEELGNRKDDEYNPNARAICSIDKITGERKLYNSISIAAKNLLPIMKSNNYRNIVNSIWRSLKGLRQSYAGYIWEYV